MLFTSFTFWAFFAVVALVYWRLGHTARGYWLLGANIVFYGWWDWRFLGLLAGAVLVTFYCALKIDREETGERQRRIWLAVALTWLLGWLFFFKYAGWFLESAEALARLAGFEGTPWVFRVVLPVGISFYTFQLLSYLVDVYRRNQVATTSLMYFSLYLSFFPQLVAGPIERNESLQPQLETPLQGLDAERFRDGLYLILHGLFMKMVVADNLAPIVNAVFDRAGSGESPPFSDVMVAVYAFAFQVYGDFAGYSSIGRGVAKWLGIDLMVNFRNPYLANGPSDFWRRWHISLSSALRDYIFIPFSMGGRNLKAVLGGLMLTMLLGGVWHGAAWTFVAWGVFHGLWLSLEAVIRRGQAAGGNRPPAASGIGKWMRIALCFHLVCVSYVFFRAGSMGEAWSLLSSVGRGWEFTHFAAFGFAYLAFFCGPLMLYEIWLESRRDLLAICQVDWRWRAALYTVMVLAMILFPPPNKYEFVYFRF